MDYINEYGEVIKIPVSDEVWLDDAFLKGRCLSCRSMRHARDSPTVFRPKGRWTMMISQCRKSSAVNFCVQHGWRVVAEKSEKGRVGFKGVGAEAGCDPIF